MINVQKLNKAFDDTPVLHDVSLKVEENELFGVIGPDGAGKTTLFRILTSLLLPGPYIDLIVDGLDVVRHFRQVRTRVGYMPGRFSLYSDLTVLENLQFFATVFGTTIDEQYDLIRDVYEQIEPFRHRPAGKLSGGMKQKLALSCALIHQPRLLVLDEPTTGVDAVSRREFWELLSGLKHKGITIVVSTPYMDEADRCDRVALMQKGEILVTDRPQNLKKAFRKALYAVKAKSRYQLLKDLKEFEATDSVFPFGEELHLTLNNKSVSAGTVNNYLEHAGHKGVKVREIVPGVEDVFMELMRQHDHNRENNAIV